MRGFLTLNALRVLGDSAPSTGSFLEAFLSSTKGDYRALRNWRRHRSSRSGVTLEQLQTHRFYTLISILKRDGLIRKSSLGGWFRTPKGNTKLQQLKKRLSLSFPSQEYPKEQSGEMIGISFDIPERDRKKRAALRDMLRMLDFKKLQQSLWIGNTKIPKEFLDDLRSLRLLGYLHIFSIGKKGTITHLV